MLWLRHSICYTRFLVFQCFSASTLCPCGSSRLRFTLAFLELFRQSIVPDEVAVDLEEGQEIIGNSLPLLDRKTCDAGELGGIGRQLSASVPHRHQQKHVGADLLGGERQRVPDEIGHVELHEGALAHSAASSASARREERAIDISRSLKGVGVPIRGELSVPPPRAPTSPRRFARCSPIRATTDGSNCASL